MTERMTDGEFIYSVSQPINIRRAFERAYAEARRARAVELEQAAEIARLQAREAMLTNAIKNALGVLPNSFAETASSFLNAALEDL